MYLEELAKIIYKNGTESENKKITVITHGENARTLWNGDAKDLHKWDGIRGWIVVEILIDHSDNSALKDYNKGKIISVI